MMIRLLLLSAAAAAALLASPTPADSSVEARRILEFLRGCKPYQTTPGVIVFDDINGDGHADLMVGPYCLADPGPFEIYFGGASFDTIPDLTFPNQPSSIGDLNGDGYSDLAIAYGNGMLGYGFVNIYFAGPILDNVVDDGIFGYRVNGHFGSWVSSLGDINGDGRSDYAIGGATYTGLYLGGGRIRRVPDFMWESGAFLSGPGDLNGDGYDDMIQGTRLFLGGPAVDPVSDMAFLPGETRVSFRPIGDIDRDGIKDLAVVSNGQSAVRFGDPSLSFSRKVVLELAGASLAANIRDVDGDGYRDLGVVKSDGMLIYRGGPAMVGQHAYLIPEVSSPYTQATDIDADGYTEMFVGDFPFYPQVTGAVKMLRFGPVPRQGERRAALNPVVGARGLGSSVTQAGDFDGDGLVDLVALEDPDRAPWRAHLWLYLGPVSGTPTPTADLAAPVQGSVKVSSAGDFNGDGLDDVMATSWDNERSRLVFFWGGAPADSTVDLVVEDLPALYTHARSVGDINGDGFDDVLEGTPQDGGSVCKSCGSARLRFGGRQPDPKNLIEFRGASEEDGFGHALGGGKDVNGDGYDDFAIGAWSGTVAVFFGRPVPRAEPDVILMEGSPVTGIVGSIEMEDLTGDGFAEVVVGSPMDVSAGFRSGTVSVFLGGPDFDDVPDAFIVGPVPLGNSEVTFGGTVRAMGDLDGDGFNDLAVRAGHFPWWNSATVFVFRGGPRLDTWPDYLHEVDDAGCDLAVLPRRVVGGVSDLVIGLPGDPYPTGRVEVISLSPNRPPDCSTASAESATLWPPDHDMVSVAIGGVTDPDDDRIAVEVTQVVQDEPVTGQGNSDACPDATFVDGVLRLRAERDPHGNGRVYRVEIRASDGRGGACDGEVRVCVPKSGGDRREPSAACTDDGLDVDALGPCGVRGAAAAAEARVPDRLTLGRVAMSDGLAVAEFGLPRAAHVAASLHDVTGRRVVQTTSRWHEAGWHSARESIRDLPAGLYYYRLSAGGEVVSRSILVLR